MKVDVTLPGSVVPSWIRYRTTQTPFIITIQILPSSYLLGFAFCVVLEKGCSLSGGECECYLKDAKGNKTSESRHISFVSCNKHLPLDTVFLSYRGESFPKILKKLKEIKAVDQSSTFNPELSFQFYSNPWEKSTNGIKECGVWPIYESDLEAEKKKKLKRKRKVSLILWHFKWQTLIYRRMKKSKNHRSSKHRNRVRTNVSYTSRKKARISNISFTKEVQEITRY